MVRHIVTWCFKDEIQAEKKAGLKADMKTNLSSLLGKVPGLVSVTFVSELLESSTHDMVLITEHESAEALKTYAGHPEHVKVADTYVRPFVFKRTALDYVIEK